MPRLSDEVSEDDWDGNDWAAKNTHFEPETSLNPTLAALNLPASVDEKGYAGDWYIISAQMREKRDFTCEKCRVRLADKKHLLHVHHLDRDKTNNDENNLQVLCVVCHSECEGHRHILQTVTQSDFDYIKRLQRFVAKAIEDRRFKDE